MATGTHSITLNGMTYEAYTYQPDGEINVMVVMHGSGRNASGIRDSAIQIANEKGYFVVAPLFDSERFGDSDLYQLGGLKDDGVTIADREDWTVSRARDFAEWGMNRMGLGADSETVLFGHSAGAQYTSRVAAYTTDDDIFDRMIVANPSTHVLPSFNENVAYGFGGNYFSTSEATVLLKDYLADPVTIYIGSEDDDPNDPELATGAAAMRQGDDRLERGLNAFEAAQDIAQADGWEFGWKLVIAPGVGHSSYGMLNSPALADAIGTDTPTKSATHEIAPLSEAQSDPVITDRQPETVSPDSTDAGSMVAGGSGSSLAADHADGMTAGDEPTASSGSATGADGSGAIGAADRAVQAARPLDPLTTGQRPVRITRRTTETPVLV